MGYNDEEYRSPRASKQYTSPKNKRKRKTKGQQLEESGEYLQDPETQDISKPLESRMFDIDPKKHKAQQKQKKIRTIAEEGATPGEQAAGQSKLKDKTILPNLSQVTDPQAEELAEYDRLMRESKDLKGQERIDKIHEAHKKRPDHGAGALSILSGSKGQELINDISSTFAEFKLDSMMFKKGSSIMPNYPHWSSPVLKVAGGGTAVLGRRVLKHHMDDILNFNRLERLFRWGDELVTPDGQKMSILGDDLNSANPLQMTGSGGKELISSKITKANRDTLEKMGLGEDWKVFNVDENLGKYTRKQTKAINSPDYKAFTKAEAEKIKIPELQSYYLNLDPKEILIELDHINPLKITSYLMDGTTKAERLEIRKILLDNGLYSGDMPKNLQALPREVHKVWTDNMNRIMGKKLDVFLKEMSDQGITSNKKMAVEYAKRIKDARKKFDIIYREHRATFGSVNWNTPENIDNLVTALDMAADLGPNWQPARIKNFVREINQNLSDLDTNPLNLRPKGNPGLQQVVSKLGLDSKNIESLSELTSVKDQMDYIREISGMGIEEIDQLLRTTNFDIDGFLKGLKLRQ